MAPIYVEHRQVSDDDLLRMTIMNKTVVSARGCWEWQGAHTRGYGTVMRGGKTIRVTRLSYELWHGTVPQKMVMRHKCDNPICVNPGHLVPGTQAQNIQDIVERGRIGRIKLTSDQVQEIRKSSSTTRQLADKFDVGLIAIRRARDGQTWKHLNAPSSAEGV